MMNRGERTGQKAQQSARPPEYIVIHKQPGVQTGAQHAPQPKKTRQSAREVRLEERLSRRDLLREQRYTTRRRRQWVLVIALVAVLFALMVLARCNT